MTDDAAMERASYMKTLVLVAVATALASTAGTGLWVFAEAGVVRWLGVVLVAVSLPGLLLLLSGAVVLARHRRAHMNGVDLFLEAIASRREAALARPDGFRASAVRRWLARATVGHDFLVGDEVEVKSLEEIRATLDEHGCLCGMPFQAEMQRYCGRRVRVFRSVDKVLDYGRTRIMRRLRGCVLLSDLRCDGTDHDQCQARCYLMWRTEWLRRPGAPALASTGAATERPIAPSRGSERLADGTVRDRFHCQFTHLHTASTPMGPWEIGKELRPLLAGNVPLRAWLIGLTTRLFNFVQARRGGTAYPAMPPRRAAVIPIEPVALAAGDTVVVRSGLEIASTLNEKNKHRGLWFDKDQLKYCGKTYKVLGRVERIIDDVHGQMLPMKTPCILLEGGDYTGETLNFTAQHDLFYWREHWLRKA